MNLFSIINNNFFNLLSSDSNNRIYSDCLLKIYDIYEHEVSFKLQRYVIKDTVLGYLRDEHISPEDEYKTTDNYANAILRKFIEVGWIEEETDVTNYERQIIMTDNGIALAEFLQKLIKPSKVEYSSYIFNIYNTLNNNEQWVNDPYVFALKEVYKNAKKLSVSLKKLSTSIRAIIEKTVKEETLQSLTDNLIAYCDGDFIKEYSRLVKQQNIHIYRTKIRSMLAELKSEKYYEFIVAGCYCEENFNSESEAENFVDNMFNATLRFLTDDYDKIMGDIKHKINIYLALAIGRARFLLNHDENTQGYIEQTMKFLIEEYDDSENDYLAEEADGLFNLFTQGYLDVKSLRFPANRNIIEYADESEDVELTDEEIQQEHEKQEKAAYNPYDKRLMKKHITTLIENKQELFLDDIPIKNQFDLLATIASVAYSSENGFDIEVLDGYKEYGGYTVRNFVIRRK